MTYFADLSHYSYFADDCSGARNVGWLKLGEPFETAVASRATLDLLFRCCSISVMQTRGLYRCDLCPPPSPNFYFASRDGASLWLGSAEIRVFSHSGEVYAAPNLIYHYVRAHHYRPPDAFWSALEEGPKPEEESYFERIKRVDPDWRKTSPANLNIKMSRFEENNDKSRRIDIEPLISYDID